MRIPPPARILVEQTGSASNIQALLDNIESTVSEVSTPADESASVDDTSVDDGEVRLAIEKIIFINSTVSLKSDVLGDTELELPDFRLANLGSKENGLTADQLGIEIARQLVEQINDGISQLISDLAKEAAEKSFREKLGASTTKSIDKLKSFFKRDKGEDEG